MERRGLMRKLRTNQFTILSGAVITEHPILFQTEMVKANLEGRKTQTRRTKGLELRNDNPGLWTRQGARTTSIYPSFKDYDEKINRSPLFEFIKVAGQEEGEVHFTRPRYNIGDLLWVKETWANLNGDFQKAEPFMIFKADIHHPNQHGPVTWKPSIHLPKAASRIWAMVEDIRVERVQDISEEDAKAEGILTKPYGSHPGFCTIDYTQKVYKSGFRPGFCADTGRQFRSSFESLWISINGQASWEANPWIWVIKYRILSKTGRPSLESIAESYQDVVSRNSKLVNPNV